MTSPLRDFSSSELLQRTSREQQYHPNHFSLCWQLYWDFSRLSHSADELTAACSSNFRFICQLPYDLDWSLYVVARPYQTESRSQVLLCYQCWYWLWCSNLTVDFVVAWTQQRTCAAVKRLDWQEPSRSQGLVLQAEREFRTFFGARGQWGHFRGEKSFLEQYCCLAAILMRRMHQSLLTGTGRRR